ncbi:MAG: hypothetical protein NC218_06055 [Acetobacter sp.]|nr:hypothetical protein [Acetobacter sp.]
MKKLTLSIILAAFLNIGITKPATSSMIIDPALIAQSIGGNVQIIYDTASQGIQQVNQLKQAAAQGINLNFLKALVDFGIFTKGSIQVLAPMVKKTKQKNTALLEHNRDLYADASKKEREAKLSKAQEYQQKDEMLLRNKKQELQKKETELRQAEAEYNRLRGTDTSAERAAMIKLGEVRSEYNKLVTDVADLENAIVKDREVVGKLEQLVAEAGTEKDATWKNKDDAVQIITEQKDDADIDTGIAEVRENDWSDIDGENFIVNNETYKKFVSDYLYIQPNNNLTNSKQGHDLEKAQQEYAATIAQIERNRKGLTIYNVSHILQVSATIRRELPIREQRAKEWFDKTKTASSELEAIAAYSNSRIESARALTLYARLLAAKLRYQAAREINTLDLKKYGVNQSTFGEIYKNNPFESIDLEKYLVTDEDIKQLIANSKQDATKKRVENAGIE